VAQLDCFKRDKKSSTVLQLQKRVLWLSLVGLKLVPSYRWNCGLDKLSTILEMKTLYRQLSITSTSTLYVGCLIKQCWIWSKQITYISDRRHGYVVIWHSQVQLYPIDYSMLCSDWSTRMSDRILIETIIKLDGDFKHVLCFILWTYVFVAPESRINLILYSNPITWRIFQQLEALTLSTPRISQSCCHRPILPTVVLIFQFEIFLINLMKAGSDFSLVYTMFQCTIQQANFILTNSTSVLHPLL
jgi:hypothetical protein